MSEAKAFHPLLPYLLKSDFAGETDIATVIENGSFRDVVALLTLVEERLGRADFEEYMGLLVQDGASVILDGLLRVLESTEDRAALVPPDYSPSTTRH
jgi:hypothetical protein